MSADSKLFSAEDSLKEKHVNIVKQMSYLELKKFTKDDCKQTAQNELTALLPEHSMSRLSETAQCISNAVSREVKSLLSRRSREPATADPSSAINLLSDTIMQELDTTIQPEDEHENSQLNNLEDDGTELCGDNIDNNRNMNDTEITTNLDDSITKLKQSVNTEKKQVQSVSNGKDEAKNTKNDPKCCETCQVKPTSKRKYNMIHCPLCTIWYHELCVGISKEDSIGLWFCPTCRCIPSALSADITTLKTDVENLKQTTVSILNAVKGLSETIENSIGNVNDRLTALQRQISGNELCITEQLNTLADTTNNIKTSFDQKACQILNKTNAVFEKVKKQSESVKTTNPNEHPKHNQKPEMDKTLPKRQNDFTKKQQTNTATPNYKRYKTNINQSVNKQQTDDARKQQRFNKPNSTVKTNPNTDTEAIDLTSETNTKKYIKEPTLLVGSSILKSVKNKDLKTNATVRSFPGATIKSIKSKLEQYNIDNCQTIILHVGGNDADNGLDIDSFQDEYIDLLNTLASVDRRLIVSGLMPRESVDLEPYNKQLKTLCDENDIDFIDHYDGFLLASGELPDTFYHKDKVHLNLAGTRKLLLNIDKYCKVTGPADFFRPEPGHYRRNVTRRNITSQMGRRNHYSQKYCHICTQNNHSTYECWFNGRRTGMPNRSVR